MANKHGVIRTDLMSGTDVAADLLSVKFMDASNETAEIDNGNVVMIEGLMEGEREVRMAKAPAANTPIEKIAIIATPEVLYDERKKNLDEFVNEAGSIARAYVLRSRNIFSVTAEALNISGEVAVGHVVELTAGTKMKVAASATSGSTVIGNIIAIEKGSRYTYYVIQVA